MSELLRKCEMTEEDVKLQFITPAITAKWDRDTQIKMEYNFTDGQVMVRGNTKPVRGRRKKADYVLYYKPNLPLAIVEAKDNKRTLGEGMQQGLEYAAILDIPFVYSSNGDAFLEHDRIKGQEREIALDDFPSPDELWDRYKHNKSITPKQEKLLTQPYYFSVNDKTPRYYQAIAINRAVEAIAKGQDRVLLVMATGTGKTYTAFQIIHRLWKSGQKCKILYLADRNILIDQTMQQDFKPFNKVMTKIVGKNLDSSYEIYMSLYQQLAGDDNEEPFRQFKPNFFDLIIVDECHRGSAREESKWRKVLKYFNSATQIGMTATPKETKDVSNIDYFGEPIYTYSLKQGISDGFLAPYKVIRVGLDKDLEGWRPEAGKCDFYGREIEDREYSIKDFDKNLIIDNRTKTVANRVTEFLKLTNRFDKTIVFCVDIDHAERMRQALINMNQDLVSENHKYVMRITGDNPEGKAQLDYFIDLESKYPAIVTTSKLMTTGVDCKTCKLIVLDSNIESMTEFKQIIGRGTRLNPEYGKEFFTIMDFRGVSRLFADPDFDGDPISIMDVDTNEEIPPQDEPEDDESDGSNGDGGEPPPEPPEPKVKYRVTDISVEVINERVHYIDSNTGKLITESVTDYSRKKVLCEFATLDDFIKRWNTAERKQAIINELEERGVLLDDLREAAEKKGNKGIDDFDLICHIAFDKKPLTKQERANGVRKKDYLSKYEGTARDVISALLDKYASNGIADLEEVSILRIDPFREIGDLKKIFGAFGDKQKYLAAVKNLENEIYKVAA
jgi:type I restriction enzyme R subunit